MKEQNYAIRLKIEGGRVVVVQMNQIGEASERSFSKAGLAGAGFTNKLAGLATGVSRLALRFVGPASLIFALNGVRKHIEELADTSERLGIAVEKLQEYRYAAAQAGESTADMDKALFNFTENVGEAQQGVGRLLPILERYKIQIKDRTPEQILRDYLDAIMNASSQQERLYLATKAFGDEAGRKLLPVLQQGGAEFERLGQKANKAGLIIDERYIEAIDNVTDKIKALTYATESWAANQLAGTFYEILVLMDMISAKAQAVSREFGVLMDAVPGMLKSGSLDGAGQSIDHAWQRRLQTESMTRGVLMGGLMGAGMAGISSERNKGRGGPPSEEERIQADAIKKVLEELRYKNEQMMRSNEEQELYNQLRAAGTTLDSKAGQEIAKLVEQGQRQTKVLKEQEEQAKRNEEAAKKVGEAWNNAGERLIDAFDDGKITLEEFGQAALQLVKDLLMANAERTEQNIFTSVLGAGSGGGGGFGSFLSSLWPFANGGVMSGNGPVSLRRYSMGGIADSPQLAMFGEGDMNEAYVPLPDGRRIPVRIEGGMGGGGYDRVIINNYGSSKVTPAVRPGKGGGRDLILQLDEANESLLKDPASRTSRALVKSGNMTQR